jgi:hypothetical protein
MTWIGNSLSLATGNFGGVNRDLKYPEHGRLQGIKKPEKFPDGNFAF